MAARKSGAPGAAGSAGIATDDETTGTTPAPGSPDGGGYATGGFDPGSDSEEAEAGEAEDGATLSLGDQPITEDPPARPHTGGWPKGKPRKKKKTAKPAAQRAVDAVFGDEPPAQKLDRKLAGILLTIVEGMTVPAIGPHARFESDERKLIEPALGNILDRMTPQTARMFSSVADPLMLGTGLLIWATRVFGQPSPARVARPTLLRQEPPAAPAPATAPAATTEEPSTLDDIRDDWSVSV